MTPSLALDSIGDGHPSIEVRHLYEIAAVCVGRKPVVRVIVTRGEIGSTVDCLQRLGLVVHVSKWGLAVDRSSSLGDRFTYHVEHDDPRAESFAIIAGKNPEVTRCAAEIEEEGDSAQAGQSLGYPACCIASYSRIEAGMDWLDILLPGPGGHAPTPHVTNKIAYLFDGHSLLPDYFPCSLACGAAYQLAMSLHTSAITCGLADRIAQTESQLRLPIAVWKGLLVQSRTLAQRPGSVLFDQGMKIVDWRPGPPGDLATLRGAGGVASSDGGIVLLDADGRILPDSCDPAGRILLFDG